MTNELNETARKSVVKHDLLNIRRSLRYVNDIDSIKSLPEQAQQELAVYLNDIHSAMRDLEIELLD